MKVELFRAKKQTHRFRENQKVWIRNRYANHLEIWHRFRGNKRYVSGVIDKQASAVGSIHEIDVDEAFGARVRGE